MRKISLFELYSLNYNISNLTVIKQYWRAQKNFNCIGSPKRYNTFLYLNDCEAEYTSKNGEVVKAQSGSIIYTPYGSEYNVRFYGFNSKNSCTIGVNLILQSSQKTNFILSDNILLFNDINGNYKTLFDQMNRYNSAPLVCKGKIKSITYDFLFHLSEDAREDIRDKYMMISKGIDYLENDVKQELQISEIAELCNVSEVYFRKLFKEYSGITPSEYRMRTKMHKVKAFLRTTNLTIAEIAERLNFADASYLIKQFRELEGETPLEYKKRVALQK